MQCNVWCLGFITPFSGCYWQPGSLHSQLVSSRTIVVITFTYCYQTRGHRDWYLKVHISHQSISRTLNRVKHWEPLIHPNSIRTPLITLSLWSCDPWPTKIIQRDEWSWMITDDPIIFQIPLRDISRGPDIFPANLGRAGRTQRHDHSLRYFCSHIYESLKFGTS